MDVNARQRYEWNLEVDIQGKYGPEFRMRVDALIEDIKEVLQESVIEPTPSQLQAFCEALQNRFDDEHGGCEAEMVLDHILGTAEIMAVEWTDNEMFQEFEDECLRLNQNE
jgi:hypothetical protein